MLFLGGVLTLISFSCNEDTRPDALCGCDSKTIKHYENVEGTVMSLDALYYLQFQIPDGLINVEPCEGLEEQFRTEGLKIIVSGELKQACSVGSPYTKLFVTHPLKLNHIEVYQSK